MTVLVEGTAGSPVLAGRRLVPAVVPAGPEAAVRLPGWAARVAGELDIEALHAVVVQRDIAAAFVPQAEDREFVAALAASVRENLVQLQRYLVGGVELDQVQLQRPLELAMVQARLRIPQTQLQRSYRVGFGAMWEAWTHALIEYADRHELGRTESVQAAAALTAMVLRYQDHAASQVAETFARAEVALTQSRAHVRQRLVSELLRGDGLVLAASDLVVLGYDLDGHHLTVLFPGCPEATVSALAGRVRAATAVRDTLVQPLDGGDTVAWFCRGPGWDAEALRLVLQVLVDSGLAACVAEPGSGLTGWRRGLEQARKVQVVRRAWAAADADADDVPQVVSYADVGLEVLLVQDDALARRFVATELGPLASSSAEAARLRLTLAASLRHGSHVAAAEALQVHEHTVRNRLQKIESLIGHPIAERRTEMQVALRLMRLLLPPS